MSFSNRVSLLSSSFLLLAISLPAKPGYGQQIAPVPPAGAGKISLDVVVTPQYGAPVAGLQQQDFTVMDNKVARPILSFAPVSGHEAPVEVILLVDAVNTGYQTVAYARDKINNFLLADGGELAHPVTLAVLTDKGTEIQQGGSRDGKALKEALDHYTIGLRDLRRSAGFYGAEERLDLSLKALDGLIAREQTKPGRKMIVWVSPGWPLFSGPGVDLSNKQQEQIFAQVAALSTRLRQARITLYSVDPLGSNENLLRTNYYKSFIKGISKPSQVDPGDLGLQVLATQSGGLVLNSNNDIAAMLKQAMTDSTAYYEISFAAAPGDHENDYHRLDVQVDKAGLIARTRSGYYAQP